MVRDTCRAYSCDNEPGEQDRDDYDDRRYCSVQCQTKDEKRRHEAREVRRSEPADMGGGETTGVQDL